MIRSTKGKWIADIAAGKVPKGFPPTLMKAARQKLFYLENAADLRDLASPPGNRLEQLKGDRAGQYSIRINEQWRICFLW